MSKGRLILHIGGHKTGSTTLQYRLLNSREQLAKNGFSYPDIGITQFAHHGIYSFLAGETKAVQQLSKESIIEELSAYQNVIISSEDFTNLPDAALPRLYELLTGFEVTVLLFFRDPLSLWPSHWQELVRHGRRETLLEYVGAHLGWSPGLSLTMANPIIQANRFAKFFGKSNLQLFSYDNLVFDGYDIFEFFWEQIMRFSPTYSIDERRHINKSFPPATIDLIRNLNEARSEQSIGPEAQPVLKSYMLARKEIEAQDAFEGYGREYGKNAGTILLDGDSEVFRIREQILQRSYGEQIGNAASDTRIYKKHPRRNSVDFGHRFWIDRFGQRPYVENVLKKISI